MSPEKAKTVSSTRHKAPPNSNTDSEPSVKFLRPLQRSVK